MYAIGLYDIGLLDKYDMYDIVRMTCMTFLICPKLVYISRGHVRMPLDCMTLDCLKCMTVMALYDVCAIVSAVYCMAMHDRN